MENTLHHTKGMRKPTETYNIYPFGINCNLDGAIVGSSVLGAAYKFVWPCV